MCKRQSNLLVRIHDVLRLLLFDAFQDKIVSDYLMYAGTSNVSSICNVRSTEGTLPKTGATQWTPNPESPLAFQKIGKH